MQTFELTLDLAITMDEPAQGLLTRATLLTLRGTVSESADTVTVGPVEATISGGAWEAEIELREGDNTLTAVAQSAGGGIGSATVSVVRDTSPPRVVIHTPTDGLVTFQGQILVTGELIDPISSTLPGSAPTVEVNGVPARLEHRNFLADGVLLQPGANRIEARATDLAGNVGTAVVTVESRLDSPQRIEELLGNGQASEVGETLTDPLTVRLVNAFGAPLAGRPVRFEVTRGSGLVQAGGETARQIHVLSDEQGRAQVFFTLGTRAGAGSHEVTVSAVGFTGSLVFCADATPSPPSRLVRIQGGDQTGAMAWRAGGTYPEPLLTQVYDRHGNVLEGVEITFEVVLGDGHLGGSSTATVRSDRDGVASVMYTLGPEVGTSSNVVTARFPGLDQLAPVFLLSGIASGPPEATSLVGRVVDNQDQPLPGVTLSIAGTDRITTSGSDGRFRLDGIPIGTLHLEAEGSTTSREGTWPRLSFEFTSISGHENGLGMPIRMVRIDTEGGKVVGGDEDVVILLRGVAGASLTVFAHSATFPDGSETGLVSFSQMHSDKVPMVAPLGASFPVAVTVQPAGTLFDPPAKLTLPNLGKAPGEVVDLFSFDHDLGRFVVVGTGQVSQDGRVIESVPGFGVIKAGWHGLTGPPPPQCNVCNDGECLLCDPLTQLPKPLCDSCFTCSDGRGRKQGSCNLRRLGRVEATAQFAGGNEETEFIVVGVDVPVSFRTTADGNCRRVLYRWQFGDTGPNSTGETEGEIDHTYTQVDDVSARVVASCQDCPQVPEGDDQLRVVVAEVDLRTDSDNNGTIDDNDNDVEEQAPGRILFANRDDDNENGQEDWLEDGPVQNEDDLAQVQMGVRPLFELREKGSSVRISTSSGIRLWRNEDRSDEVETERDLEPRADELPETVWVESLPSSSGEQFIQVEILGSALEVIHEDRITLTSIDVRMTAYRAQYANAPAFPLADDAEEIPEADEEDPGVGIRINGDDDDTDGTPDRDDNQVGNENDLIQLDVEIQPATAPQGITYLVRTEDGDLAVWEERTKGNAILDGVNEQEIDGGARTVWAEWSGANAGAGELEFCVRVEASGQVRCPERVAFRTYTSLVIALSGELILDGNQDPSTNGIFPMAQALHEEDYDIQYYNEDEVGDNGAGVVLREVRQAIQGRGVAQIAIFGHSHGGGSTFELAEGMQILQGVQIVFTGYIDAIREDRTGPETRFPPNAAFLLNFFERRTIVLRGDAVDNPLAVNVNVNEQPWGVDLNHGTIDNNPPPNVTNRILQEIENRLEIFGGVNP